MDKNIILEFLNSKLSKDAVDYYWQTTNNIKVCQDLEVGLKQLLLMDNSDTLTDEEINNIINNFTNHVHTCNLDEDIQMDVVLELLMQEKAKESLDRNPIYTTYKVLKKMLLDFKRNNEKRYNISNLLVNDMTVEEIELYNQKYNYERKLSEREIKLLILKEHEHLLPDDEINFYREMLKQQLILHKRNKDEVIEAIYNDYDPVDLNGPYIYSLVCDNYIHTEEEVSAKFRIKTLMANKHMFSDAEYKQHYATLNNELIMACANKKTFIK